MKLNYILTALIISASTSLYAQTEEKTIYPVVISFNSQCCGVPSDSAVKLFIRSFKKQYKIKKISAYHIGPMGREGEYYLAFKLNELNKKKAGYFISKIKQIKKLKSDKGTFTINENFEIDPATISRRSTFSEVVF